MCSNMMEKSLILLLCYYISSNILEVFLKNEYYMCNRIRYIKLRMKNVIVIRYKFGIL